MKTPSITEFENSARAAVDKQKSLIESIAQEITAIEHRILSWSTSPNAEAAANAVKDQLELVAKKALLEGLNRNFRAASEYEKHLTTEAGKQALVNFLEEKRRIVDSIRYKIKPIRQEALSAEEKGDDETAFAKHEAAAELVDLVKSYEGHLSTAEQALRRSDATTRYIEIRDQLHLIYA
jgi:hypothetical protein